MNDNHTYEIIWYAEARLECGCTEVRRHDLTDAITAAVNLIKRPRGDKGAADAHGFFVRVKREAHS